MWSSTVGLVNGKHRYLTAETFGFKVNSNGQQLKRRQQWTIEPFPENTGPDGSISSAASVTSTQCPVIDNVHMMGQLSEEPSSNNSNTCIMTLSNNGHSAQGLLLRHSNGSNNGSDHSETCDEEHENVAIKSHLNKYLAVDSFGNVTCDSDEKTENARFTITICSMSQGRSKDEHIFWAFKNVERGYYLGTTEDGMICCNAKMPKSRAELWHLHLLPARGASFFALKSLGRKRFARVSSESCGEVVENNSINKGDCQVQLDANISWGPETLFQFKYFDGGRYALLTSDNKCLTNEGKCVQVLLDNSLPSNDCLFTLEYHSGYLAFRDSFGHYLAAAGRSSILRSRSIGVSRDELFMFEGVPVQVSMKATFNNRWVSIKQGVDVSANQMDTTSNYETFQLTYHKQTQLWSIMTKECNFWTISKNTNTVCVCRPADYEALTRGQFKIVWSDNDATFSLKFIDHLKNQQERWIVARKSGQLFLGNLGGSGQDAVRFIMRFQNRRLLNLRPIEGSGFVGLKSQTSKQLEANKTCPDSIQIEYSELPASFSSIQTNFCNGDKTHSLVEKEEDSNKNAVINIFNVKLNSTKNGQSYFANKEEAAKKESIIGDNEQALFQDINSFNEKQINCMTIDSNNNEPQEEMSEDCGVESVAAPSVASIINTFSNVKVSGDSQQQTMNNLPVGSQAVSKLASSFEAKTTTSRQQLDSSTGPLGDVGQENGRLADQVAQFECCYMKLVTNEKYLVVGSTIGGDIGATTINSSDQSHNSSILCNATNKASAQSWILELRSHNSIAIRASDTQAYMQLGTNGTIYLSRCDSNNASLWEF